MTCPLGPGSGPLYDSVCAVVVLMLGPDVYQTVLQLYPVLVFSYLLHTAPLPQQSMWVCTFNERNKEMNWPIYPVFVL